MTSGQILIGQMMTASIVGITTPTNYYFTWNLTSGGGPFASWPVSAATSLAPVPAVTGATNSISFSCFFSQGANQVTVTPTITPINDTIPPVTLTPSSVTFRVMAPTGPYITGQLIAPPGGVMVAQMQDAPPMNGVTGLIGLGTFNSSLDYQAPWAIVFSGTATTPSPSNGGGWDFWQTADSARRGRQVGPPAQWMHLDSNGTIELDTALPYKGGALHLQGNISGDPLDAYLADTGVYSTNDNPPFGVDSSQGTELQVKSLTGNKTLLGSSVQVGDVMEMYQMYCPPDTGLGTCFVPLEVVEWTWMGDALFASGNWALNTSPVQPTALVTVSLAFPSLASPCQWPTWTKNVKDAQMVPGQQ